MTATGEFLAAHQKILPMSGKIHHYLAGDHQRLDALLERAISEPQNIAVAAYAQFRAGLLKHIAMEERFFCPRHKRRAATRFRLRPGYGSTTVRWLRCSYHRRPRRLLRPFAQF
jgi:hypothetical protein